MNYIISFVNVILQLDNPNSSTSDSTDTSPSTREGNTKMIFYDKWMASIKEKSKQHAEKSDAWIEKAHEAMECWIVKINITNHGGGDPEYFCFMSKQEAIQSFFEHERTFNYKDDIEKGLTEVKWHGEEGGPLSHWCHGFQGEGGDWIHLGIYRAPLFSSTSQRKYFPESDTE